MALSRQAQRIVVLVLLLVSTAVFYLSRHCGDVPPKKMAILHMTTVETNYDWMVMSNKQEYASKHDYDLIWSFSRPSYAKIWDKLEMIRHAFQATIENDKKKYDWIWMLDYDTLITNPKISIKDIIKQSLDFAEAEGKNRDEVQLILTRDCEPLNAGSMFFKVSKSPWMLEFLDAWRSGMKPNDPEYTEQDMLRDMLKQNVLHTADKSVIVPQTLFNAYPEELHQCRDERDPRSWEEGMFVIHFPGARWWYKDEVDIIRRFMQKYYQKAYPDTPLY